MKVSHYLNKYLLSSAVLMLALVFPRVSLATECQSIGILPVKDSKGVEGIGKDLYKLIEDLEKSFQTQNKPLFAKLVHPSIHKPMVKKEEILTSTLLTFGLEGAKLNRTEMFKLSFEKVESEPEAECGSAKIRGVVGPLNQVAVVHSAWTGSEQVRIFTILAPVPESVKKQSNFGYDVGIVLLQSQVWTHAKKPPEKILEEAQYWGRLDEPLMGHLLAEGAKRILVANPYYTPKDLARAENLSQDYREKITQLPELKRLVKEENLGWEFEDFTTVYQSSGLEVGLRFRTEKEENYESLTAKCKQVTGKIARSNRQLRKIFKGFECLPYLPTESSENPPSMGSQFLTWKALEENAK